MTKLSLYLATLLLGTNFSVSTVPKDSAARMTWAKPAVAEQQLVDYVNSERWDRNVGVLSVNPVLVRVAREHSKEMYEKSYFDHISPTPGLKTPMARYLSDLDYRPNWACLAENLCYCSEVDIDHVHESLMESPEHRANILDGHYNQVGVGAYESPDGRIWVTQLFLSQVD